MKNFSFITLEGKILHEIEEEGKKKGQNWKVPRLFITRNEQSPSNIAAKLDQLRKQYMRKNKVGINEAKRKVTEKDALKHLIFPFYSNTEGGWRKYSEEEANDLKERIKKARGYS